MNDIICPNCKKAFKVDEAGFADILKQDKNISQDYFLQYINKFKHIDFSDNFYTASGIGKSRIQNSILRYLGFKSIEEIKKEDEKSDYQRLTKTEEI